MLGSLRFVLAGLVSLGCSLDLRECEELPVEELASAPQWLSQTGYFADATRQQFAADVRPFEPRFALWTDGAVKRRFIALPSDTVIDTSDMNEWVFPVGTKLWKEFSRDGVRAETRYLHKIAMNNGKP